MSLGRPTQGLTVYNLRQQGGRADAKALCATTAVTVWEENIPLAEFSTRAERREIIFTWAGSIGVHPRDLAAIVLVMRRHERVKNTIYRFAA